MMIQLLHQGFDGLDIAFKASIRPQFVDVLEEARDCAIETHTPQLVELAGITMHVGESGASGGYRYRCDTGILGAVWFIKRPNPADPWGIRVSSRALPLALNGVSSVLNEIMDTVHKLTGPFETIELSISRVDYALDFLLPDFQLNPDQFVMHSHLTRTVNREMSETGRSGRVHSVRIGKMPGQQVAIYDKRADVISKGKRAWWEIWNETLEKAGLPRVTAENSKGKIWRTEFRAGKEFLKERMGIRTWHQFEKHGGDVFAGMADEIRYVSPCNDQNRGRWPLHPLWIDVQERLISGLSEMTSGIEPQRVREIARHDLIGTIEQQILGCLATLAAAEGLQHLKVEQIADTLVQRLAERVKEQQEKFREKIGAALDRYYFI